MIDQYRTFILKIIRPTLFLNSTLPYKNHVEFNAIHGDNNKKNRFIGRESLQIVVAKSFYARLRGLIGRRLPYAHGLLFQKSHSLHTCFMTYNLTILFLDNDGVLLEIVENLKPWRYSINKSAQHFLEIPSDWPHNFKVGDSILLNKNIKGD